MSFSWHLFLLAILSLGVSFVLQGFCKVLASTTCIRTTGLAQNMSQYYFALQDLRKILPTIPLYYNACAKHIPVRLYTTRLAQSIGTCGTGLGLVALGAPWSRVTPRHFCVAGVPSAPPDPAQSQKRHTCQAKRRSITKRHACHAKARTFAWQTRHLVTSTFVLRGSGGTW